MSLVLRYTKLLMVASVGLLFTFFSFNNLTDMNANWSIVKHVLSMDTTHAPNVVWRAITNPIIQRAAFYLIIGWQILTAIFCWTGCFRLLANIHTHDTQFNHAKNTAFIGLFFAFILYIVGFIVIGGEWFYMWQSASSNTRATVELHISLIMLVMIFLAMP